MIEIHLLDTGCYKKDISKFVGMVLMLNVSSKNIKKDFKWNYCMYFLQVIFFPHGSAKIVNIHCWQASTSIDYILQSILL